MKDGPLFRRCSGIKGLRYCEATRRLPEIQRVIETRPVKFPGGVTLLPPPSTSQLPQCCHLSFKCSPSKINSFKFTAVLHSILSRAENALPVAYWDTDCQTGLETQKHVLLDGQPTDPRITYKRLVSHSHRPPQGLPVPLLKAILLS